MINLAQLFKSKGIGTFVEGVDRELQALSLQIQKMEERIKSLENQIEISSALLVAGGSFLAPIPLQDKFIWIADDIGDFSTGFDAITYDKDGTPTRWAAPSVSEVKFLLPINRDRISNLYIKFNNGIHESVLKGMSLLIDERKYTFSLRKGEKFLTLKVALSESSLNGPTSLTIKFTELVEGASRHTLGVCQLSFNEEDGK